MLIDPSDTLSIQKSMGLILAVLAIFFTIYKKDSSLLNKKIALPLLLFLGMGITDSLIRYAQFKYLRGVHVTGFTSYVFLISFIIGIIIIFMKRRQKSLFNITILFYGVLLGLFNYASLYFFIMSLNHFENFDGSTIFAINNTSIVLLASITGLLIFQEKLSNLNKFGIALSICAIYIISTF
jgi:drug/metabolite transporter (DMT)-like permease